MDIAELTQAMHQFVADKGWYEQDSIHPQRPKNLAMSLAIEAAEVLELYQWQDEPPDPQALSSELADVMLYLIQLASICQIDMERAVLDKLRENYDRDW